MTLSHVNDLGEKRVLCFVFLSKTYMISAGPRVDGSLQPLVWMVPCSPLRRWFPAAPYVDGSLQPPMSMVPCSPFFRCFVAHHVDASLQPIVLMLPYNYSRARENLHPRVEDLPSFCIICGAINQYRHWDGVRISILSSGY
ncbi:hypothetical protein AcW1_006980 [Taiwanofungus camphoratus]|nr:hypothetical protein AcW2_005733 [Antrodia cinnamomea]KAI0929755.1 hypothetical protein AcV7_005214 [Antrodia cinnamomea]KAI0955379.1 hypothetical protein AcW1_006980 [Antrodia cinnamomea]